MIYWLLIAILSYLFFSFSYFGDKLILSGSPNPKSYTFYVGILNVVVVFLIPFIKFGFPDYTTIVWMILEAVSFVIAIYIMFLALEKFNVSMVMPAIGTFQPIFIFILTWLFFGSQTIKITGLLALLLLLSGGFIISIGRKFKINLSYLKLVILSSLIFSFEYIFSKIVFLNQPFLQGLIWMKIFTFLITLTLIFNKKFCKQIFSKKIILNKRNEIIFLLNQLVGGTANILQSFAIFLVPVASLATMNALRGIQYVFLFIITLTFSLFFPKILKEKISKGIIIQKIIAILFIGSALALLAIS